MKRVLIAIVTIALLLTACGAKAPAETTSAETVPTETAPAETTPNYLGTWKLDYLLVAIPKSPNPNWSPPVMKLPICSSS